MQAEFREWLRGRLKELDWSMADLERFSGVSNSNISRWLDEEKPRRPTPDKLEMIAGPLGVSHDALMRMCNYTKGSPKLTTTTPHRQILFAQVDRWLTAVGLEYAEHFCENLTECGEAAVRLVLNVRTAVNVPAHDAINSRTRRLPKRGRRPQDDGKGPLMVEQHTIRDLVHAPRRVATELNQRLAA